MAGAPRGPGSRPRPDGHRRRLELAGEFGHGGHRSAVPLQGGGSAAMPRIGGLGGVGDHLHAISPPRPRHDHRLRLPQQVQQ